MEGLIDSLTRGNSTEVMVLLASVALGLAVYQLVFIAVGSARCMASPSGLEKRGIDLPSHKDPVRPPLPGD